MVPNLIGRVALGVLVLAYVSAAKAGPADLQGISAEQQGRANPVASSAGGAPSIVMNPARMGFGAAQQMFGVLVSGDNANIVLLGRTPDADVGASIYRARNADGSPVPHNLATEDLPNLRRGRAGASTEAGLVLGMVVPVLKDRLSVGLIGYLPGRRPPAATFYTDEREAVFSNSLHLALHEDDHGAQLLAGAVAYQPLPWLRVGLGAQLTIGAETVASAYLPDALGELSNQTNLSLEIKPSLAPVLGVEATPYDRLAVQASLRTSQAARTTGENRVRLWADDAASNASMTQEIDFALDWQPARAAVGLGWQEDRWDLNAEGVYARWSSYVDHHNQTPLGEFDDVVELGLHGAFRGDRWFTNAGVRYSPSPVPAQSGRENHADADRYIGGLGGGHRLTLAGEDVEIALGSQVAALRKRTERKTNFGENGVIDEFPDAIDLSGNPLPESDGLQTNNPGWPGYRVSGWLWATTLTLTWKR